MAAALGTLMWGQLFLLLGLAGLLRVPLLRAMLAAGAAGGLWDFVRRPPDVAAAGRELREAGAPWLALLSVHLLLLAPYSLIPETFYDALVYHLALPSLYLLRGRIGPVPDNAFSGLPALHSMVYGCALALEPGGLVAHLLNFGFFVASCAAILGLARRLGHPRAGGPAALLFAVAPLACGASRLTGTEMPWTFWQTSALLAVLAASQAEESFGPWAAAGLIVGAAMSTKTIAWALPAAALAAAWTASGRRPSGKALGWAAGTAAFMLGPWIVKDLFFYGNPIYPFFHEFFRPNAAIMPGWRTVASERIPWGSGFGAALAIWLKTPLAALHPGSGDFMQIVNPVMIGLLPFGLWRAVRGEKTIPAVWYAALCWFPLSLATNLTRFFLPVTAVLCLIAALALEEASSLLRGLAFAVTACLAFFIWRREFPPASRAVMTGQITDRAFVEHGDVNFYSTPSAAAASWLDSESPRDARVLVFGDARGFRLTRDYLISTAGQTTVLERWSNSSADARELRARFAAENVAYIIVNHGEIL
ncbi:MAG TPA: glycosyltransferase family 39 protein, partial [Elusimicrobiota bacterium]|nr:glycosyltransferase family 39 protein [Elusimicrobiota bacterium]